VRWNPFAGRKPQPLLEPLEPRLFLSADVVATWIGASGDWWEPANWDIGTVPNNSGGTTYRAVLDVAGEPVITSNRSVTLNDLVNAENLRFTGGTSVVHDEVQNSGTVGVEAGTLRLDTAVVANTGGRIEAAGGIVLLDGTTVAGGTLAVTDEAASSVRFKGEVTLNSLTWDDPGAGEFLIYNTSARLLGDYGRHLPEDHILVVWSDGGADAQLSLGGGVFTNDGMIELRNRGSYYGHQAVLYLESPVTLGGGGEVLMDRAVFHYGDAPLITGTPGATLTVGPDQWVHGVGEIAVEVFNEGWISADCSDGENDADRTLTLPGPVTNRGVMEASATGILSVDGDLVLDGGGLQAYANSGLDIDGDLVLDGEAELFTSQGQGVIRIEGDLLTRDPSWPWLWLPNVTFDGAGSAADPQRLEVIGADDVPRGIDLDAAYWDLQIENGTYVRLVDESDNAEGAEPEALYAWSLYVEEGATLDLNGLDLYLVSAEVEGSVIGGALCVVESPASDLFPHGRAEVGTVPVPVAAGDLNEDGTADLVVGNRDSGTVSVLLGTGDGSFEHQVMFDAGKSPRGLALGDVDGDGHLDAITANVGSEDLSVLLGNGDGTFQDALSVPFGEDPTAVALGDLDKDGTLDIVVADKDPSPGHVGVLWGQGDGTFLLDGIYDVGDRPESVALGDVSGDGLLDIVVANTNSWDVSVLLAAGDGTFQAQTPLTAGRYPASVALGDLDGDEHLDLVVANYNKWNSYNEDCISVFLGVGNGGFLPQSKVLTGDSPQSVALADLDGDGVLDALTANNESNDVSVLLGVGDGTFGPPAAQAAGYGPRFLATDDFNDDGHVDVAVVDDWSDAVSVLLGAGDGTLWADAPASTPLPGEAKGIALGDVDADGRTDLLTTNKTDGRLWLLRGSADGSLVPSAVWDVGTAPVAVALGDFNGDGLPDAVTANYDSDDVSVLLGDGGGGFGAEQRFAAGDTPHSLALGDTNSDGHLDIVTANPEADQVAVLLGVGDGTFFPPAFYDDPETPADAALGDVDGDGHLDIVTANLGSDDVNILLGSGDGTFVFDDWYSAGWGGWDNPYALALGDVTEDGVPDIVCATQSPEAVAVLWGHGDGTFGLWKVFPVAETPTSLALADMDGDGHPDVVTTGTEWGDVSVLLGAGGGLFLPPARFNVLGTPYSVAVGLIDDDAHPDIACVQFDGGVAVLLNQAVDVEVGREVTYDALGTAEDYEYWVDVEGLGLSDLEVATPWAETFRMTDYLPVGWAGEDFEHYDAAGGIDIEAGTEDGRRWFEVDWEDLTAAEWASLETSATDLVITYAGGDWAGSADFAGAPLPGEAPTITYPTDGRGGASLEPVFEWDPWAAPGTDAYVDCWVDEVLTGHEPYGAGDLPPDSTWWTPLPGRLDADTDYEFGVTFGNAARERAGEVGLETVSETSSEVAFSTAALGVSVERNVWYDGFPAEETRSYEYAVEVMGQGLERLELATPWGGAFDSALYLGPVWNGAEFYHEEPGFSFWAGADGDHRVFELEWWNLTDPQWAALEAATSALDVAYAGGSWSGVADFAGVAVPLAPHVTAPVHGQTQVEGSSPFLWDAWPAGGPGTRIEAQVERTDTGQEAAQAILPTAARGWTPPAPLEADASYDFDLEFFRPGRVSAGGVDVQTASSAEHAARFCTGWPWSWIELDWRLAGTTVAPGETVTIPWSGRFTADDRVTLYWDADDNPANNDALAYNHDWGVLATDIPAWDRQYELTVDVDTPPGAYYLYAVTQNQEEAGLDYTDGPVYVELQLMWRGAQSDHWDLAANWDPERQPIAGARVAFADAAPHPPMLYRDESVEQVDFQTGGWTIGGSGHTLTVGSGGIDSAGTGTNTVEPDVAMAEDSTWTVGAGNTLVLGGALSGGDNVLTKDGDGTLVLNGGQDYGTGLSLTMNGGMVRLGGRQTLVLKSLTFGSEPTLDLAEGDLVVDYDGASPHGEIATWVQSGLNLDSDGYWDGAAITSSAAAAHPQRLTAVGVIDNNDPNFKIGGLTEFAGVPVDETSVLAAYTWWGDANLDGVLDSNDYDMIDTAWLLWTQQGTVPDGGFRWAVGDFNYDGIIDSNDYDKIDTAWLLSGGAPCAADIPLPAPEPATRTWGMDAVLLARESGLAEDAAGGVSQDGDAGRNEMLTASATWAGRLAVMPAVSRLATGDDEAFAEEQGGNWATTWTGTDQWSASSDGPSIDGEFLDLLALPALEVLGVP